MLNCVFGFTDKYEEKKEKNKKAKKNASSGRKE